MTSLNLNPESYTDKELQKLLSLPNNYTHQDIIKHKQKLLHQLNRDSNDTDIKNLHGLTTFLDTVTRRLTSHITDNSPAAITGHMSGLGQTSSLGQTNSLGSLGQTDTSTISQQVHSLHTQPNTLPNPMKTLNAITQHGNNILITNRNQLDGLEARIPDGRTTGGAIPAGHMNPINVRTIEQSINIDSRFRKNYYSTLSTQFSLTLPEPQKNVVKMSVDSLELPLTHYAISSHNKNNTCLIINASHTALEEAFEKSCDKKSTTTYSAWLLTLPDGNYEPSWIAESMARPIEPAMNIAIARAVPGMVDYEGKFTPNSTSTNLLKPKNDIFYGIDRTSGKSFFQCPSGTTTSNNWTPNNACVRFNVDMEGNISMDENIQMRLGWVLGFRAARYVASNTYTIASEGICYPVGPIYGFLAINDYQKNTGPVFLQAYTQSAMDNNIIAKINLSNEMGSNAVFKTSDSSIVNNSEHSIREYFGPVNIHKLDIALYDEYGRIVNLNNMDLSLTLRFEKLYD